MKSNSLSKSIFGFSLLIISLVIFSADNFSIAEDGNKKDAGKNDYIKDLQTKAIENDLSDLGHWGNKPEMYTGWGTHTNRLIPVYTYGTTNSESGVNLNSYINGNSIYRNESSLKSLFGRVPSNTLNPNAVYCDQTDLAEIQYEAFDAGKKNIFIVIFDGMDWQTARNAAIYKNQKVEYDSGKGKGLHFLDYSANETSQFGFMVTTPHNSAMKINVDLQTAEILRDDRWGGYNPVKAGENPWTAGNDSWYPMGLESKNEKGEHSYPDSASTATAVVSGIKTYNSSINVSPEGQKIFGFAHQAQSDRYARFALGVVTSVPISHATPACSYAHNVSRNDYQDITRDLLGLPSISNPDKPLAGLDVLIGCGNGVNVKTDKGQGQNFVPGNKYITDADLKAINFKNGGNYFVAQRMKNKDGGKAILQAAKNAAKKKKRFFGFYGGTPGKKSKLYNGDHLPYQTANGDYSPAPGRRKAESYSAADIKENPTLAEMTSAALIALKGNKYKKGVWLMVEAGDVDWANHDNNIDNSIGAVIAGDEAVKVITDWVEKNSNWEESMMIVTADHGHYFNLLQPEMLIDKSNDKKE